MIKNIKKSLFSIFCLLLPAFPLIANISFGKTDINENDELLFTVSQNVCGSDNYSSLFYAKIKNGEVPVLPELITFYPERMELLDGGRILQIRNRFGSARYDSREEKLTWVKKVSGLPQKIMPSSVYEVSPDGKWICRVEKTEVCLGKLLLENALSGQKIILSEKTLNTYESIPVKWAPDSSVLVYEKNDSLYFCNPDAMLKGIEIEEKFRRIGRGSINSVCWGSEKYLAYVDDYLVYRINTKEMYTIGLYAGIIGQGKAIGRLPFQFNPLSDKIFANKDVTSFVTIQNNRLFSYLTIQSLSCDYMDVIYSRPYTDSSASLKECFVFWDKDDNPILWQEKLPYLGRQEKGSVYRLGAQPKLVLEISDSGRPYLSPDSSRLAFFSENDIYIYDINSWQCIAELNGERVSCVNWIDRANLYVGGEQTVRRWNLLSNNTETITLSSALECNWDASDNSILAGVAGGSYFKFNSAKGTWTQIVPPLRLHSLSQNGRYRVFTGKTQNPNYENALYIRTLTDTAVTKAVYPVSVEKQSEKRKVALIFDACDNADGLPQILSALKKYNVSGTFFVNGEFIRRYPMETKQIVQNGHDCASMFFTTADLTAQGFTITEDFIRRGLARNEDEFYECTGKELNLYWHAPDYKVTDSIKEFGKLAGYSYVNNNFKFSHTDIMNVKAEKIIDEYNQMLKFATSGIIPVITGYSYGIHEDPLYRHMDLLICSLLDSGYEIVSLNQL